MNKPYYSLSYGGRQLQNIYRFFQEIDELWRSRKAKHVAHPTICVGNFQAGGTGKTPTTLWLADELKKLGYAPSIVLRGHKGKIRKAHRVRPGDTAENMGDEALLHAEHFPTYVGKNRVAACELAIEMNEELDHVLILDDGLQHYPLKADVRLVCTKGIGFWQDELLPLGRLRQIPHNQIDAILHINSELSEENWEGVPIYQLQHTPALVSGEKEPGLMVSGVAHPRRFFDHIFPQIGNKTFDSWPFPDHHAFSNADLRKIETKSSPYHHRVHCTAKDAVKLQTLIESTGSPIKLSIWDIDVQPVSDISPLVKLLREKIQEVYKNRTLKQG